MSAVTADVHQPNSLGRKRFEAALQEFCENSGMDRLVILLNARLQSNVAVPAATRDYFVGEFTQVYAFVTEPLAERAAEVAGGGGDIRLPSASPRDRDHAPFLEGLPSTQR